MVQKKVKKIIKEEKLNVNQDLKLEDLLIKVKTNNGQIIDLSKWIFLKLNDKAVEEIWNFANKSIPSKGRYDAWKRLAKQTYQNISSIKHKNERKRAKSLLTFYSLIKLLNKYSKKYNIDWLKKNALYIQFKQGSASMPLPKKWTDLGVGRLDPINLQIPKKEFNNIKTKFISDKKELTYNLELKGKIAAMVELDTLFKKYNKGVFALKKEKVFQYYLYNHKYSLKEYLNRYDKNGDKNKLGRYWS